ncbi:MAG: hypothetical protein H6704_25720 [Myxococcales bacterium]|nr:hypothetical protein [Myxococcales bacterium]
MRKHLIALFGATLLATGCLPTDDGNGQADGQPPVNADGDILPDGSADATPPPADGAPPTDAGPTPTDAAPPRTARRRPTGRCRPTARRPPTPRRPPTAP